MRAALATVLILSSSSVFAQCVNVDGLICGVPNVSSAVVAGAGTRLFAGQSQAFQGTTQAPPASRVTMGNVAGDVNLGACTVNLPALSNVAFTTAENRVCISGVQNLGAIPPNTSNFWLAAGVLGVGGVTAVLIANTVSP
jgi:hypothetical protein